MSYNITDNVNKNFDFSVEGKRYFMDYPVMGQVEELQEVVENQKEAADKGDKEEAKRHSKQVEDFVYDLIYPEKEDQEDIRSVMKRQNIKAVRNFNAMIQKELGLE